eukprot:1155125-Pelagomonas_calceolata.AAC.1
MQAKTGALSHGRAAPTVQCPSLQSVCHFGPTRCANVYVPAYAMTLCTPKQQQRAMAGQRLRWTSPSADTKHSPLCNGAVCSCAHIQQLP